MGEILYSDLWPVTCNLWPVTCDLQKKPAGRMSGKYVTCKPLICTQSNNGLKSACERQFFCEIFSYFQIKEKGLCLAEDILGPRSENVQSIFRNVQIILVNFLKVFWALSDKSEAIPQILTRISHLCVRKSWQLLTWQENLLNLDGQTGLFFQPCQYTFTLLKLNEADCIDFFSLQYKQYSTLLQLCHGWIISIIDLVMYFVPMKVR